MSSAKDIFLNLDIPEDDPLRYAKRHFANCPPGVRLMENSDGLRWESDYLWLICINEEDGLQFDVLQTLDGDRQLQATWQGKELESAVQLKQLLQAADMWQIYQLRATVILHGRVQQQLQVAHESELENITNVRPRIKQLASHLRTLEVGTLQKFEEFFETEVRPCLFDRAVRHKTQFTDTWIEERAAGEYSRCA